MGSLVNALSEVKRDFDAQYAIIEAASVLDGPSSFNAQDSDTVRLFGMYM